jgi:energy-coupling factor transporter ATP-binding protein EcfA2
LADHASLTDADFGALVSLCKQEHGITDGKPVVAVPLTAGAPVAGGSAKEQVVIQRVTEVVNVNALRSDQHLNVAEAGLTVVYGENGAGKSGYVRILKQLCRARGGRDAIHPNIYMEEEVPASAVVQFKSGTIDDSVRWTPSCAAVKALGEVSIFDARSAAVYVTKENDVAYLPQGMDLFPRLVVATEEIGRRIEQELSALESKRDRFESIPTGTKVWALVDNLGAKSARTTLKSLKTISDQERVQLAELRLEEKRLTAVDATARAKGLRLVASRLRSLRQRLQGGGTALSDENASALRDTIRIAATAREAARLASSSALSDAPIRGVGSDTWKQLWELARQFAVAEPALEQGFPPMTGELCLLCQQPITAGAATRLTRFEAYIQSAASAQADKADAAVATARSSLATISLDKILDDDGATELDGLGDGLATKVRAAVAILDSRRKVLVEVMGAEKWPILTPMVTDIDGELERIIAGQVEEAIRYEQAVDPTTLTGVLNAIKELEARIALTELEPRVIAQIEREERRGKLKACVAATNTAAVTKRNSQLLKDAVTTPLADEFLAQLKALELTHVPIAVEASHGQKGRSFHTITLGKKSKRMVSSDEVLSEGEQRCIALAAFFAEVSLQKSASTLIFDDPVSSLDHGRRKYVARRLVELAKARPILVFTHDLTFLWMLQGAAETAAVELKPRLFRRDSSGAGLINEEWPWDGQRVPSRIGVLKNTLVQLQKAAKVDRPHYESGVRAFYGRMRDTWERAVEEILFNGAIRRFGQEIQTLRLKSLHKITEVQMQQFEAGMTRTSEQAHDHPPELALPTPEPTELEADLKALDDWVASVRAVHK